MRGGVDGCPAGVDAAPLDDEGTGVEAVAGPAADLGDCRVLLLVHAVTVAGTITIIHTLVRTEVRTTTRQSRTRYTRDSHGCRDVAFPPS